jgi:trk system potassium uptake protein TrkH
VSIFNRFRIVRTASTPPDWLLRVRLALTGLILAALVLIVLKQGYQVALLRSLDWLLRALTYVIVAGAVVDIVLTMLFAPTFGDYIRRRWFDLALLVPIVAGLALGWPVLAIVVIRQVVVLGQAFTRSRRFAGVIGRIRLQPVRLMALSFVALIVAGTLFLTFPAATTDGRGAPPLDALFTAASATCVTGLIVRDTAVFFSRFGQTVILTLVQLGGLGIMTFYASIMVLLGRRLGPAGRQTMASVVEDSRDLDLAHTLRYILSFTVLAEAGGTLVLFLRWLPDFARPAEALYAAAFHSISAFCNAGFSTFSDSLIRYQGDVVVNLTFIVLIVVGGLGFSVVHELFNRQNLRVWFGRVLRRTADAAPVRPSTHALLVFRTSGVLLIIGMLLFFFLEYDNALARLPLGAKLIAAAFQSVTPRTAGFNTVPFDALRPSTLVAVMLLMFIGASPGGTGGGIKTTSLALLWLTFRNLVAGRSKIEVGGRTVPDDTVFRASAIFTGAAAVVAVAFGLLLMSETLPFQNLLFETVSAFGTVGLSTGVTPHLSPVGKLVIIVLMYIGRLGPLTLALIVRSRQSRLQIQYPQARVMVG